MLDQAIGLVADERGEGGVEQQSIPAWVVHGVSSAWVVG
jgi:hypothetical protein